VRLGLLVNFLHFCNSKRNCVGGFLDGFGQGQGSAFAGFQVFVQSQVAANLTVEFFWWDKGKSCGIY